MTESGYSDGSRVIAVTGTSYTIEGFCYRKMVTFKNASAVAVTVAAASDLGGGFHCDIENLGAGTVTLTPASGTIDGASSLTVSQNKGLRLWSDGTNLFTERGMASGGSGSFTAGGDLSGSDSSQTVIGWRGKSLDTSIGSPTDGDVATYDGTAGKWKASAPSGGSGASSLWFGPMGTIAYGVVVAALDPFAVMISNSQQSSLSGIKLAHLIITGSNPSGYDLSRIGVYFKAVDPTNPEVQFAVYDDSSYAPNNLVASSAADVTISTVPGWTFGTMSATLSPGTYYWLAWQVKGSATAVAQQGGNPSVKYNGNTYGSWPASFGAMSNGGYYPIVAELTLL